MNLKGSIKNSFFYVARKKYIYININICIPLAIDSLAKEKVCPVDDAVEIKVSTDWLLDATSRCG